MIILKKANPTKVARTTYKTQWMKTSILEFERRFGSNTVRLIQTKREIAQSIMQISNRNCILKRIIFLCGFRSISAVPAIVVASNTPNPPNTRYIFMSAMFKISISHPPAACGGWGGMGGGGWSGCETDVTSLLPMWTRSPAHGSGYFSVL